MRPKNPGEVQTLAVLRQMRKRQRKGPPPRAKEPAMEWQGSPVESDAPQVARAKRRLLKRRKPGRAVTMTLEDVPPGSILSDQTIEDIKAGRYALRFPPQQQQQVRGTGSTPDAIARRERRRQRDEA